MEKQFGRVTFVTTDQAKTIGWLHDNLVTLIHEYQWASDGLAFHYGWFRPTHAHAHKTFLAANPEATILPHLLNNAQLQAAEVALLQKAGVVVGDGPYAAYSKAHSYLKAAGYDHDGLNPAVY